MKIIYYILLLLLISCKDNTTNTTSYSKPIKRIEYTEKYCSRCNGVGEVELSTGERVLWGVVTFGGGFMFETIECSMCNGTGIIKVRKLNNK